MTAWRFGGWQRIPAQHRNWSLDRDFDCFRHGNEDSDRKGSSDGLDAQFMSQLMSCLGFQWLQNLGT